MDEKAERKSRGIIMYERPYTEEERKTRHMQTFGTLDNFPEERRGATPYTDEERKTRHMQTFGTLDNFPEERRGVIEPNNAAGRDFFIFFIGAMSAQILSYAIIKWLEKKK